MANVDIIDNSDQFKDELKRSIERALEKCGLVAETYAKLSCPYKTGRLRNSITHATTHKHNAGQHPATPQDYELRGTPEEDEVVIGTNVEYAQFVELGSTKRRAKPYLRPAIENHIEEYRRIINSELRGGQ